VANAGLAQAAGAVGSLRWETMFERLHDDGVTWKFYQEAGSAIGAAQSVALAIGFNALLYFEQYVQDPRSDLSQRAFAPVWPDEFLADVAAGTLPQVSWILPPIVDSEHPSASPVNGEMFVARVLSALVANPKVWSKTSVFITYDENGGWFDHVPPPTPPAGTVGEHLRQPLPSTAQNVAGPIGLGFRVPCLVVSPFSRGGNVVSETFDHTSLLRFLEQRFGTRVPNLTAWRRKAVGDLTSALDLRHPDPSFPPLPSLTAADAELDAVCPANEQVTSLLLPAPPLTLPQPPRMPTQER